MVKSSKVDSKLETKASEHLQKQVEAELNQPDPSPEKAKAVLDGDDEDSKRNDGERSSSDNQQGC